MFADTNEYFIFNQEKTNVQVVLRSSSCHGRKLMDNARVEGRCGNTSERMLSGWYDAL